MKSGEELSVFDELFERIDEVATQRPEDGRSHDEDRLPPTDGTRLTPIKKVGKAAVDFMIFSSGTRSLETGRLLYGPSITVFRRDAKSDDHIKRRDLETRPNGPAEAERYETLVSKLETAVELFDQYEQTTSD